MVVALVVIGENYRKYRRIYIVKNKKKYRIFGEIRYFLVEISGIEPLTS